MTRMEKYRELRKSIKDECRAGEDRDVKVLDETAILELSKKRSSMYQLLNECRAAHRGNDDTR